MDIEVLQWIYQQILKWRAAAGQRAKLNPRELGHILDDLDARMPGGLAGYVVLGCEWLFRIRELGPREREHQLRRVESGLAEVMPSDDAYAVTEALEGKLSRKLPRHRELAAVLELRPPLFVHGDMVEVDASQRRTPSPPPLLIRRGPIPWPAPWVSGLVIERLLRRRGLEVRRWDATGVSTAM